MKTAERIVADKAKSAARGKLQQRLATWQMNNFGAQPIERFALGAAEELGELCHAVLKHSQGIRGVGSDAVFEELAGDAIADCVIYLMQMASAIEMDFNTLIEETAENVMDRDWANSPDDGVAEVDESMCGGCNGSGEGQADGTRCGQCLGTGVDPSEWSELDD